MDRAVRPRLAKSVDLNSQETPPDVWPDARRRFSIYSRILTGFALTPTARQGCWRLPGFGRVLKAAAAAILIAILAACGQSEEPAAPSAALPTVAPAAKAAPDPASTPPPTPSPTQVSDPTPAPSPTLPATVTVTDSIGREVELPGGELERIISLAPSATEILFAIGAGNRVIGVDDFSNYPAETADIPKLGSFSPDLERIVALEPDLVVGSTITSNEVIEQLESLGIAVLIVGSADCARGRRFDHHDGRSGGRGGDGAGVGGGTHPPDRRGGRDSGGSCTAANFL